MIAFERLNVGNPTHPSVAAAYLPGGVASVEGTDGTPHDPACTARRMFALINVTMPAAGGHGGVALWSPGSWVRIPDSAVLFTLPCR